MEFIRYQQTKDVIRLIMLLFFYAGYILAFGKVNRIHCHQDLDSAKYYELVFKESGNHKEMVINLFLISEFLVFSTYLELSSFHSRLRKFYY